MGGSPTVVAITMRRLPARVGIPPTPNPSPRHRGAMLCIDGEGNQRIFKSGAEHVYGTQAEDGKVGRRRHCARRDAWPRAGAGCRRRRAGGVYDRARGARRAYAGGGAGRARRRVGLARSRPHRQPAGHRRGDAVDGAVPGDQGRQSGQHPVVPDGRLLRAVLRGRRRRLRSPRHRADQARQAPGAGHPDVRRADPPRRRLPAEADRQRLPRRRLRTIGRPGRGQEARPQGRRAPRRGAPRVPRHHHRGGAARRPRAQLSHRAVPLPRRGRRARLARHLDGRVRGRRGGAGRSAGRTGAAVAERDPDR